MPDASIVNSLAPTGVLRASINLGNPVLAQGTADEPTGVTVDIARTMADRLGIPVSYQCFDAARDSFEALRTGAADVGFLAIEPARAAEVYFTAPYVLIEGVYAVPLESSVAEASDVDRAGTRVAVKNGSAYDLFLTRTLRNAALVRGAESLDVFRAQALDVVAGIRQPLSRAVAADPSLRLVEPAFMQIRQAVATSPDLTPTAHEFVHDLVEELKSDGFVADSLRRAGQDAAVAGPEAAH
jgi:polar amino acid transport system substrate-binding protein